MSDMFGHAATGSIDLRDYQVRSAEMIDAAIANGSRAPLLVVPTGGGKTTIAAWLMRREVEEQGRSLFLAPRRELIFQASGRLRSAGLHHGVLLAGEEHREDYTASIQVASIDTIIARVMRRGRGRDELGEFTQIIVDEAHLAVTERRAELLDMWPDARVIGLTATPVRKDGRALGLLFDALVEPTSVRELTEAGYLVRARYFSLSEPDLRRVRTTAGDYNAKDLEEAVNNQELVGDIVTHWCEHAEGRRTVVFCAGIAHSVAVADQFQQVGVRAEHVDANTPTAERAEIFARFIRGDTTVLTNCFLASYGFDLPELSCVILARPTKSLMLYLQMLGRGLRPADGKTDCLVLDHAGCVHMHGFADDIRPWTLEGKMQLASDSGDDRSRDDEPRMIDCPECAAVFTRSLQCPECGYRLRPVGQAVDHTDGKLVEMGADNAPLGDPGFFAELRAYAHERGYKAGWAIHKYKEKFGILPPREWNRMATKTPTIETQRWIRSRQIAWANASKKAAQQRLDYAIKLPNRDARIAYVNSIKDQVGEREARELIALLKRYAQRQGIAA